MRTFKLYSLSKCQLYNRIINWSHHITHQILRPYSYCCCIVTKSCLTLCDLMDCSPPGCSVHGISQSRILEQVVIPSSRDLPYTGIKHASPALAGRFSSTEASGKPHSSYNWMEIIPLLSCPWLLNLSESPGSCRNPQWYRLVMNLSTLVHSGSVSTELEEGWRDSLPQIHYPQNSSFMCEEKQDLFSNMQEL